jgi:hypothetical protein
MQVTIDCDDSMSNISFARSLSVTMKDGTVCQPAFELAA